MNKGPGKGPGKKGPGKESPGKGGPGKGPGKREGRYVINSRWATGS